MKRSIFTFIAIVVILLLGNCGSDPELKEHSSLIDQNHQTLMAEGFQLMHQNCTSCHLAKPEAVMQIAPDLASLKTSYLAVHPDEKAFVRQFVQFLENPEAKNAMMSDAINQYGIMPNLGFSQQQYQAVAYYFYHSEVEQDNWYAESFEAEKKKYLEGDQQGEGNDLKKGQELALATKAVLGKNLLFAIKNKGAAGAVAFCNERAIHLTDSMGMALNAHIKRVSDRNRNPGNQANREELAYIQAAKTEIAQSGKAKPKIIEEAEQVVGYYPIMTNEMCLKCHGKPDSDIDSETLAKLHMLYPEDQARGYGINELRGIWVVEMDR